MRAPRSNVVCHAHSSPLTGVSREPLNYKENPLEPRRKRRAV